MGNVGVNLKRLRKQSGLTQMGLAELSGVSRATIAVLETGARLNTESRTIERLASALGAPDEALFSIDASLANGRPRKAKRIRRGA